MCSQKHQAKGYSPGLFETGLPGRRKSGVEVKRGEGGRRLFMYTLREACGDFYLQSVGCILPKEEEEEEAFRLPDS